MTEVLGHGDDGSEPRRRLGSFVAGAATLALLGVGVAGALRSPEEPPVPRASASPSTSSTAGWTEYPPDDPFALFASTERPAPGKPQAVLVAGTIPVVVADQGGELVAYEAIGGPAYAPVLLGLCPEDGTLLDPSLQFGYLDGLPSSAATEPLRTYPVRESTSPGDVDVGITPRATLPGGTVSFEARCTAKELRFPPLPQRVTSLAAAGEEFALMSGRYVVTTETRAFCPSSADGRCRSAGWEEYGPYPVLPPDDLAGSYTWQGDFLVRADPSDGSLTVVRTPSARLASRERVGVRVRVGWAEDSYDRNGVLHLRFNPFRTDDYEDDSPPGPGKSIARPGLVDERGGLRDYALAPDAEVHLGRGITGLGQAPGTPALLRDHLRTVEPYAGPPLWLVFGKDGRVIRVVLDPD